MIKHKTKDCSKCEQLIVRLRYVDENAIIQEHFLIYIEVATLNAEGLAKCIIDSLKEFQLDLGCIVSQGYDGTAFMSGRCTGVQQRLRSAVPYAMYVHCYAHTLNLVLVDSVEVSSFSQPIFLST